MSEPDQDLGMYGQFTEARALRSGLTASRSGSTVPYPLTDADKRAMDAASLAMDGEPDATRLLNALCRWDNPPPMDDRWLRKLEAACEIAVAFCKFANNLKPDNATDPAVKAGE